MEKFQLRKQHVYICRHGESLANTEGRIIGCAETPLTEKGIRQAHIVGRKLRNENIDLIVSSPLSRALDTARIISQYTGARIMAIDGLKPQSFGVLEGCTRDEASQRGLGKYLHRPHTNRYTHYVPGGETIQEVQARVMRAYVNLTEKARADNLAILAVLHNSVIRTIAGSVWQSDPDEWVSLAVPNCSVLRVAEPGALSQLY